MFKWLVKRLQCLFKGHEKIETDAPNIFFDDFKFVECKNCGKSFTKIYVVGEK